MNFKSMIESIKLSSRLSINSIIIKINNNFYSLITYFKIIFKSKFNIKNILHIFT